MSFSLKTYKLGDIAEIQTGPFGSQLHKEDYTVSGTPIITVEHLGDNRILHENTPFVSNEDRLRLSKYNLSEGDIVFSRVGSVDRRAYVSKKEDGWLFSGRCLRVRVSDKNEIDPKFLSYFFGLEHFKEYVRNIAVGATMPSLNTKILSGLEIQAPDIVTQREIAKVLSSIDDKIEVNNAINKNLEAVAQALFKRWFVDFEFPNEKGESYKSSGGEFEESELGLIPKGWKVVGLNEIIQINPKRILKKGIAYPYVEMKNLINNYARVTGLTIREFSSGSKFSNGDILLARITPCLENGKTAYVDFLEKDQVGWGSTEFIVLRTIGKIPNEYAYFLARSEIFRTHAISNMTGSSGRQRVPDASLRNFRIAFPCDLERIIDFGGIAKSALGLMKKNDDESGRLKAIRDSLLPKLTSGEIQVPLEREYLQMQIADLPMAAENKAQYSTT